MSSRVFGKIGFGPTARGECKQKNQAPAGLYKLLSGLCMIFSKSIQRSLAVVVHACMRRSHGEVAPTFMRRSLGEGALILALTLLCSVALAQERNPAIFAQSLPQDTVPFTFDMYYEVVRNHHPVALSANLRPEMAAADQMSARGGFDPKLSADLNGKEFDRKHYYSHVNAALKVPTWWGIDVYAGYSVNDGSFLNPEKSTPMDGLVNAGLVVPLGEGLFIDERRAMVKLADLALEASEMERRLIRNELLLQAGAAYWEWYQAYQAVLLFQEALEMARLRYEGVISAVKQGDRSALDTVEAGIQYQNRQIGLQQATLDLQNTRLRVGTFLWEDGLTPLELVDEAIPSISISSGDIQLVEARYDSLDTYIQNHPELLLSENKIATGEVNLDLKREQLKPTLDLKYNALAPYAQTETIGALSTNDYSWGVQFSVPIFLRKERGAINLAKLQLQDASFGLQNKSLSLTNKALETLNSLRTAQTQRVLYNQVVADYRTLLEGERRLFNLGESSLFLVNSRELTYIQSSLKLIEMNAKYEVAYLKSLYALGVLGE